MVLLRRADLPCRPISVRYTGLVACMKATRAAEWGPAAGHSPAFKPLHAFQI